MKALFIIFVGLACSGTSAFNSSADGINASSPDVGADERPEVVWDGASSPQVAASSDTDDIDSTSYYYGNNHGEESPRMSAKYDDTATYLDLFGERAKELLTQHIIPSTDAQCRWDWRMGRCEPYCTCGFLFLWGDYHLGRSCRLRPNPPPTHFHEDETADDSGESDETSWQEAWQEVWQSQMAEGDVKDASAFVPPMFPKSPPDAATEESNANTCTLPPESRYIQIIRQLAKTLDHSASVVDGFDKVKNATSKAAHAAVVGGRHQWANLRQGACETVKRKVEERAKIRDQPVVLTRQGATWIRRVCGSGGDGVLHYGRGASAVEDEDVVDANEASEDSGGSAQ